MNLRVFDAMVLLLRSVPLSITAPADVESKSGAFFGTADV
jgi:hypothetical protein